MSAFAKFFKRVGAPTEPLPPTEAEKEAEREKEEKERKEREEKEKQKEREKEQEKAKEKEKEKDALKVKDKKQESLPKGLETADDPPLPSSKDKSNKEEPAPAPQWPARRSVTAPAVEKDEPSSSPKLEAQEPPKADDSVKATPKLGLGLPPPGTVTKKEDAVPAKEGAAVAPEDDDDPEQQFVAGELDQKYVGLVIGKAGETIKTFKKQSGASIEIDQNLPDGMPRVVIYRGTKKQVALAKQLVENLVKRAKEDEKGKTVTAPASTGMGIMGRGETKDGKEIPPEKARTISSPTGPVPEDPGKAGADLPPWRRLPKAEDEQQLPPPAPQRALAEPVRRQPPNRRDAPWMKNQRECEAAPSGSLTGGLTGSLTGGLSMRPSWMKPKGNEEEEKSNPGIDRSVWQEQRYGRSLMLQAKQKTLKMKAYEVPAEMMTMTTGPRPKYKAEKKEKDAVDEKEDSAIPSTRRESDDPALSPAVAARSPPPEDDPPPVALTAIDGDVDASEEAATKKHSKGNSEKKESNGLYENLPGDSKDIMKLKKKLREIQKIEEQIASGEKLEPNKVEKVTKKAGILEELKVLESIVHSSGVTNGTA